MHVKPSAAYLCKNLSTKKANILGAVYLGITFSLPVVRFSGFYIMVMRNALWGIILTVNIFGFRV